MNLACAAFLARTSSKVGPSPGASEEEFEESSAPEDSSSSAAGVVFLLSGKSTVEARFRLAVTALRVCDVISAFTSGASSAAGLSFSSLKSWSWVQL